MDKVDSVMLNCMRTHYDRFGIDLDVALDSLEQQLIRQEVIGSADASGIKAYYEQLANDGKVPMISYTPMMDSVIKHHHIHSVVLKDCIYDNPKIDDSTFANSRYQNRQVLLSNAVGKLDGEVYVKVATAILHVSDLETFSLPIFRAHFLLSVITVVREKYLRK